MSNDASPAHGRRIADEEARADGDFYICTWLYAESEDEESTYPQVRGRPSSAAFQATYWRCVGVFFASSYRHQPRVKHVLFTNAERVPQVSGVDVGALLARLGVEIVRLPLTYTTPPGHYPAWRNQFYVLDIVAHLAGRLGEADTAAVFDSDCVWVDRADAIRDTAVRDGAVTYVITLPPEWAENGLTRAEMRAFSNELLGADVEHPLPYCGGEFIAGTGRELARVHAAASSVWPELLARWQRGETGFNEEAQLLSHLYFALGYPVGNGDPFVRRIWTGSFGAFNTAQQYDRGLLVWHLPMEKRFGIRRLFPQLADPGSAFWSVELGREWRAFAGSRLGVPRNGLAKTLRDLGWRLLERAQRR